MILKKYCIEKFKNRIEIFNLLFNFFQKVYSILHKKKKMELKKRRKKCWMLKKNLIHTYKNTVKL